MMDKSNLVQVVDAKGEGDDVIRESVFVSTISSIKPLALFKFLLDIIHKLLS